MSIAHTWFDRTRPSRQCGRILWPGYMASVVRETAIERLYPDRFISELHMTTADLAPCDSQRPRSIREKEIDCRSAARLERPIGRSPPGAVNSRRCHGDVQSFRLLGDRQVVALRSSLCAQPSFLPNAASKKSFSSVSSPILACRTHVDGWRRGSLAAAGTEHIGCSFLELPFHDVYLNHVNCSPS